MRTLLGSCTKHDATGFEKTPLYNSLLKNLITQRTEKTVLYTGDIDAVIKTNNQDNIGKHYNRVLEMSIDEKYDCVILMHDDVSVEDKFLFDKIAEGFQEHDVVGLAGARNIELKEPTLWHIMSEQSTWSGAVAHPVSNDQVFMTNFGPTPARCLVLDGLFLAIKVSSLTDKVRFDENIPAVAHAYDIDFSLTCNDNNLKLTTWPIWVVHRSPGLEKPDDQFSNAQKYFLDKWKR